MKIDTNQNILGFPILKIRDLLKWRDSFTCKRVADKLKITENEAQLLLDELTKLGYVTTTIDNKNFTHCNTIKGNALALSKALSSITKEKAEQLFNDFMERVKEVNNNDYYLYKVSKVILFGSYITDKLIVNDIDIAIEIIKKEDEPNVFQAKNMKRISEAKEKGIRFSSVVDELFYPHAEVQSFLKSKVKYLSIHDTYDEILNQTETKQFYP